MKENLMNENKIVRVAFEDTSSSPNGIRFENIAPGKSFYHFEYIVLYSLYSTLVEFDNNGNLVSGLASFFEWEGNRVRFHLKSDFRTIKGTPITAQDAANSIKRILALNQERHGRLKDMLCDKPITSITDECSGISVINDNLILEVKYGKEFLLPMLTSADFSIFPRTAMSEDWNKIVKFDDTSGAYFFDKKLDNGTLILKSNRNHWKINTKTADEIHLIPMTIDENFSSISYKRFLDKEIDHITTDNYLSSSQRNKLSETQQIHKHNTHLIQSSNFVFTPKGRKKPNEFRQTVSIGLQRATTEYFSGIKTDKIPEFQYLPPESIGGLNEVQILTAKKSFEKAALLLDQNDVVIGLHPDYIDILKPFIQKHLPNSKIVDSSNFDRQSENGSEIDIYISATDVSFKEDISMIIYSIEAGYFPLTKESGDHWISNYMKEEKIENRKKLLQDLHYRAIVDDISVVPIALSPYVAFSQNGWKMNLPKIYSINPLWALSRE